MIKGRFIMHNKVEHKHKKLIISLLILALILLLTGFFGNGMYKYNKMRNNTTYKNDPINGILNVNLGDDISVIKSKNFSNIETYNDADKKYTYTIAEIDGNHNLIAYSLRNSNKIYKLIYESRNVKCNENNYTLEQLRDNYGVGEYNFFWAAGDVPFIRKGTREISISCSMTDSPRKEWISYVDFVLERKIDSEYEIDTKNTVKKNLVLN